MFYAVASAAQEPTAMSRLTKCRVRKCLDSSQLQPGTQVFFFNKQANNKHISRWERSFVSSTTDHTVLVRRNSNGKGALPHLSYEEVALAPSSTLIEKLDQIEFNDNLCFIDNGFPVRAHDVNTTEGEHIFGNSITAEEVLYLQTSLYSINQVEGLRKDIGCNTMGDGTRSPDWIKNLELVERCLLEQGHDAVALKEVPPSQLSLLPPWLIYKPSTPRRRTCPRQLKKSRIPASLLDPASPNLIIFSKSSLILEDFA
jgi:hypothetical protein